MRTEIVERILQLIHEFDEFMVHFGRFGKVRQQGMKGRLLAVLRVANDPVDEDLRQNVFVRVFIQAVTFYGDVTTSLTAFLDLLLEKLYSYSKACILTLKFF